MNLEEIQNSLIAFVRKHRTSFDVLASRETQALELGALVLAAEHYGRLGYNVTVANLQAGMFKVKLKHGHPRTFSWYCVDNGERSLEIHANLLVQSARDDGGRYEVDVGVVEGGHTPPRQVRLKDWPGFLNPLLRTFVEAKRLVIYPMLLAQFTGIVHEIQPQFLNPAAPVHGDDFFPALVCLGSLRGTSANIRHGFNARGMRMNVLPAFDLIVTRLAKDPTATSPFQPAPGPAPDNPALADLPF